MPDDMGPLVLGRRTLRALFVLLIVLVALSALLRLVSPWNHLERALPVLLLCAWLLMLLPGVFFLAFVAKHRREDLPPSLRRSATDSGIAPILFGLLILAAFDEVRYLGVLHLALGIAVIVMARVATGEPEAAPPRVVLRHSLTSIAAACAFVFGAAVYPGFTHDTKEKGYVVTMRSDLRLVRIAEESFHTDSLHYTADTSRLEFHSSSGPTRLTIQAGAEWWSATDSLPYAKIVCGTAINKPNPVDPSAPQGVIACKEKSGPPVITP